MFSRGAHSVVVSAHTFGVAGTGLIPGRAFLLKKISTFFPPISHSYDNKVRNSVGLGSGLFFCRIGIDSIKKNWKFLTAGQIVSHARELAV